MRKTGWSCFGAALCICCLVGCAPVGSGSPAQKVEPYDGPGLKDYTAFITDMKQDLQNAPTRTSARFGKAMVKWDLTFQNYTEKEGAGMLSFKEAIPFTKEQPPIASTISMPAAQAKTVMSNYNLKAGDKFWVRGTVTVAIAQNRGQVKVVVVIVQPQTIGRTTTGQ